MKTKTIRFLASVADIQNAITFKGDGDGGRVVFEVPRSEAGALLLLQQTGTGQLLRVTLEIMAPQAAPAAHEVDELLDEVGEPEFDGD